MKALPILFAALAFVSMSPLKAQETVTYTYDALGRLVAAANTGTVNNGVQTTYNHDSADNRTNVTVVGASQ